MIRIVRARDGAWIPWAFVAAFLVVIAANATMAAFAFGSWTGIETRDHYRKGLAYNEELQAVRRQAALGWQGDVAYSGGGEGGRVEFTLRDRAGAPVAGAVVRAAFVRPTSEGHDFELPLDSLGGGRYAARVALPLPGLWEVRVAAERGADEARFKERIVARP